jgi:hypothetical protein
MARLARTLACMAGSASRHGTGALTGGNDKACATSRAATCGRRAHPPRLGSSRPNVPWSIKARPSTRASLFSFGALVTRSHPRPGRAPFDRNRQPIDRFQNEQGLKLPVLRLQHAKFKAGGGVTTFGSRGGIMLRRTSVPLSRRVEAGSTGTYTARRGGPPMAAPLTSPAGGGLL